MHPYATDSVERKMVPLLLAALSVAAAFAFPRVLQSLGIKPPWWLDVPSVLGFYAIFYSSFDHWLWRWPILRAIGLVRVSNLEGQWEGYVTSSFDDFSTNHRVRVQVIQTWTRMSVILRSTNSASRSLIASLLTQEPDRVILSYQYLNEPHAAATPAMNIHHGTTRLVLSGDGQTLDGDYYSARGRRNIGVLHLERVRPKVR